MDVRFLVDRDTGLPHIYGHGVNELEVLELLRNRHEDAPGREGTRIAEGQTLAGRYLRVIYRLNELDHSILVITGYDLAGKARKAFLRRRRRRRGQ